MDEQNIRNTLHALVEEEIPDVELWNKIESQIKQQSVQTARQPLRLLRYVAAVLIVSFFSAVGYAVYQMALQDPTIPENRVTAPQLEQTVEGVTLSLDWVYADAHRITIGYSYVHEADMLMGSMSQITLQTADGITIPQDFGGGGGGGGGGTGSAIRGNVLMNFDASVIPGTPQELDLVLTIVNSEAESIPLPGGSGGSGGSGGGSGGSGGEPAPMPTVDRSNIPMREYRFEFSVPFIPAQSFRLDHERVEDQGAVVTVSDVRVTPSMTRFTLCFTQPTGEEGLKPLVMVDTGEGIFHAGSTREAYAGEADETCFDMNAPALADSSEQVVIRIDYFAKPAEEITPEFIEQEEAFFAEMGYTVEIELTGFGGYALNIRTMPEGVEFQQGYNFVSGMMLQERLPGNWTVTASAQ